MPQKYGDPARISKGMIVEQLLVLSLCPKGNSRLEGTANGIVVKKDQTWQIGIA